MINATLFLLQLPTIEPTCTSTGWLIGLTVSVVGTLLFVWRQNSQNSTARLNAEIAAEQRDAESRKAQENTLNEVHLKYDKLMDETRIKAADERNEALKLANEMGVKFTELQAKFIDSQAITIKMQSDLTISRNAEAAAIQKADKLENTVRELQNTMDGLQQQLTEANVRIDELSKENKDLQNKVQSISTGSVPKVKIE